MSAATSQRGDGEVRFSNISSGGYFKGRACASASCIALVLAVMSSCAASGSAGTSAGFASDGGLDGGGGDGGYAVPTGPMIYVSPSGNDGDTGAAPANAVQTIQVGIVRALACSGAPCNVAVAAGNYTGPITLGDGVKIFAGYTLDFATRDPASNVVLIKSTSQRTVIADGLTASTMLDGVNVVGADMTGTDGSSTYAMWINNAQSNLYIANSSFLGGKGATGTDGAKGMPVTCNAKGGTGGVADDCDGVMD